MGNLVENMSKKSNVQRTLEWFRSRHKHVDIDFTERKIPYTHIKKDLFGVIDLLILVRSYERIAEYYWLWAVQVCGGSDFAAHKRKILASRKAYKWVCGEGRGLVLMGWRKLKRGWSPRVHKFTRGDWKTMPPAPTSQLPTPKVDRLKP